MYLDQAPTNAYSMLGLFFILAHLTNFRLADLTLRHKNPHTHTHTHRNAMSAAGAVRTLQVARCRDKGVTIFIP